MILTRWIGVVPLLVLSAVSCRQDMHDQPRYEPLEASSFFGDDGRSSRDPEAETVARGQLREDGRFYEGRVGDRLVEQMPIPATRQLLERGRERYEVFCAPCHDRAGYGEGIVVRRGFRAPPSFHIERLRLAPAGHYYDVITNGLGAMYSYASRVEPADRWAIIAYIRALQLSQNARLDDAPEQERLRLQRPDR